MIPALAALAAVSGCSGGGLEAGTPKDVTTAPAPPPGFQDMQKSMGKDMMKAAPIRPPGRK